jgi:hypothetical protein
MCHTSITGGSGAERRKAVTKGEGEKISVQPKGYNPINGK